MRIGLVVLLASCGVEAPPVLRVNVHVTADQVYVSVRERDRACSCSSGNFPDGGACVSTWSDISRCTCDPPPGWCLDRMWIENGGGVIGGVTELSSPGFGETFLVGANELAFDAQLAMQGCEGKAVVPIGAVPMPIATITEVVEEPTGHVTIGWETAPVGTRAIVTATDNNIGGRACLVPTGTRYTYLDQTWSVIDEVSVAAVAGPTVHETPLGSVSVWSGTQDTRSTR